MDKAPLISVITVTFNAEKEIDSTLNSLKRQSYQDFEHIVIDGDSKDSTVSKIRDARLPNSVILSEPDRGLYDAMNKGLRLASGKYVIFLNAGDAFFDDETLARYKQAAQSDYDIIYGDTWVVDENNKILKPRHLSVPEKLDFRSFSKGMLICHQAFMVKKTLTSPYNTGYRFSADFDWCIECIKKSSPENCCNLNGVTVRFLHAGTTDKNKIKSLKERFHIMTRHYGLPLTLLKHLGFIFRALRRRF